MHGESGKSIGTSYNLGARQPMQTHGQLFGRFPANIYHCPKPSRGERNGGVKGGNNHPTVKPTKLMAWLCTLIGGQKSDLILDPFMGSGSTGIGALKAGFNFVGIEKSGDYVDLARSRIKNDAPLFYQEVRLADLLP